MANRLGIVSSLFAQPLFEGLRQREGPAAIHLVEDSPAQLAIKLRNGDVNGAFLSPIDYAKEYPLYHLLPAVGAVSKGRSNAAVLFFKEHLRRIETVAVDPRSGSEVVLAHLVLAEKYDTAPAIVPFIGPVSDALAKADAVLCSGDAVRTMGDTAQGLDLVEEWGDISDLPFVHGLWAVRRNTLPKPEVEAIIGSGRVGKDFSKYSSTEREYLQRFHYILDEEAQAGLVEFFRMAYYHGILRDLPDIVFYPLEETEHVPQKQ